jgi:hypothetical protein
MCVGTGPVQESDQHVQTKPIEFALTQVGEARGWNPQPRGFLRARAILRAEPVREFVEEQRAPSQGRRVGVRKSHGLKWLRMARQFRRAQQVRRAAEVRNAPPQFIEVGWRQYLPDQSECVQDHDGIIETPYDSDPPIRTTREIERADARKHEWRALPAWPLPTAL